MSLQPLRPNLRVIPGDIEQVEWAWFCGHCASPSLNGLPPAPNGRVCRSCDMGVLLEARADDAPRPGSAFLVVDSRLLVQAVSTHAEKFLGVREETAVNRAVSELLMPADAEAPGKGFASLLASAVSDDNSSRSVVVRPANTFGVRIRARISACGPPRAALVVLDGPRARPLRAV
jgi:hypothetical protein